MTEAPLLLWLLVALASAQESGTEAIPTAEAPLPVDAPSPDVAAEQEVAAEVEPETAAAADVPEGVRIELAAEGERSSNDVSLYVRADGNVYLDDELMTAQQVGEALSRVVTERPDARIVVGADAKAAHGRVVETIQLALATGIGRIAIEGTAIAGARAPDPLFPGRPGEVLTEEQLAELGVTELGTVSKQDLKRFKPKRYKFPQNPYGSTDFTAYTLEFGEAKIGLLGISYGVAPRVQLGTSPLLDAVGLYNANLKANVMREGPVDGALLAQVYYVPVNQFIRTWDDRFDLGLFGEGDTGEDLFTAKISYVGLGAMTSVQVLKPWSIHAGAYYGRLGASGMFEFDDLPSVLLPGLDGQFDTEDSALQLVPKITGELVVVRLATDIRFNRRDSLVLQYQAGIYARAKAGAGISLEQIDGAEGIPGAVDLSLAYGGIVPADYLKYSTIVSAAWQFSWKHLEARVGAGWSGTPYAWIVQPLALSYRFGGNTRRTEHDIREGYRDNRKDLRDGAEGEVAPSH